MPAQNNVSPGFGGGFFWPWVIVSLLAWERLIRPQKLGCSQVIRSLNQAKFNQISFQSVSLWPEQPLEPRLPGSSCTPDKLRAALHVSFGTHLTIYVLLRAFWWQACLALLVPMPVAGCQHGPRLYCPISGVSAHQQGTGYAQAFSVEFVALSWSVLGAI